VDPCGGIKTDREGDEKVKDDKAENHPMVTRSAERSVTRRDSKVTATPEEEESFL
jgi:hypothetical protein